MILLTNATLATMIDGYGLISGGAVVMGGTQIAWAGPQTDLPAQYTALAAHDCQARLVTSTRTSLAQPSGSNAVSANKTVISASLDKWHYVQT